MAETMKDYTNCPNCGAWSKNYYVCNNCGQIFCDECGKYSRCPSCGEHDYYTDNATSIEFMRKDRQIVSGGRAKFIVREINKENEKYQNELQRRVEELEERENQRIREENERKRKALEGVMSEFENLQTLRDKMTKNVQSLSDYLNAVEGNRNYYYKTTITKIDSMEVAQILFNRALMFEIAHEDIDKNEIITCIEDGSNGCLFHENKNIQENIEVGDFLDFKIKNHYYMFKIVSIGNDLKNSIKDSGHLLFVFDNDSPTFYIEHLGFDDEYNKQYRTEIFEGKIAKKCIVHLEYKIHFEAPPELPLIGSEIRIFKNKLFKYDGADGLKLIEQPILEFPERIENDEIEKFINEYGIQRNYSQAEFYTGQNVTEQITSAKSNIAKLMNLYLDIIKPFVVGDINNIVDKYKTRHKIKTKIIIPEKIDEKTVKVIGKDIFKDLEYIEEVSIPNTVTVIKESAFYGCRNLKSINLENVKILESKAFAYCENLKNICLSDSIEIIPEFCFEGCSKIDKINLKNVKKMKDFSFEDCSSIENIELPPSIEMVPNSCFRHCKNLKHINLKNVKYINESAFEWCEKIESINLPPSISTIPNNCFRYCKNLKYINLENIKSLREGAFGWCYSLENINLPSSVDTIPEECFISCENLKQINLENVKKIKERAFKNCKNLEIVYINHSTKIDNNAFEGCDKFILIDRATNEKIEMNKGIGCSVFIALAILFSIVLIILLI